MTTAPKRSLTLRKRKSAAAEENLRRIAALRKAKSEIEAQIKERQGQLLKQMEDAEVEQVVYKDEEDGVTITGTRVQSTSVSMDETALKKKLGATLWGKLTRRVLDHSALERALADGEVQTADVAAVSTITKNNPYIKVTVK